jgi:hypothetical protein
MSKDENPTNTTTDEWWPWKIKSSIVINGVETWAYYPGIAVDEEAVDITTNMFEIGVVGPIYRSLLWIVHKGPCYPNGTPPNVAFHDFAETTGGLQ